MTNTRSKPSASRIDEEQIAVVRQAHRDDCQVYEQELERLHGHLRTTGQAYEQELERLHVVLKTTGQAYEEEIKRLNGVFTAAIETQNDRLAELERALAESNQSHAMATDEIARLTAELGQREVRIAEQQGVLDLRDDQLRHLLAVHQHQALDLESIRRRNASLRQLIDAMLGSRIWRLRLFLGALARRLLRPIKRWHDR